MSRKPNELRFEEWIEQSLNGKGYQSVSDVEYDKNRCILPHHLLHFLRSTQSDKLDKLVEQYGEQTDDKILHRISSEISKKGLITVLREGITDRGVYLDLVYFQPKSGSESRTSSSVWKEYSFSWFVNYTTPHRITIP
jgi:type I restriction enzyme, R subunit